MPIDEINAEARRLITERCLIAADIDKTVLAQGDQEERCRFLENIAPQLLRAAALGTHLAFLTGNSMHELSTRFLRWLIDHLCHTDRLELLDRFHFFCNSGGVYAYFSPEDEELKCHLSHPNADEVFHAITERLDGGKRLAIHPRFIDAAYIQRCRIPDDDAGRILAILEKARAKYVNDLKVRGDTHEKSYDLTRVCDNGELKIPHPDLRIVRYGSGELKEATVQITLKPILSFRHAHEDRRSRLIGKDLRSKLTETIQKELDTQGLGHYVARPGGRSSIDVTPEKLDKAYALEFLIDHLNLQGHARRGQKFGSNAIYLGDEVIVGGGNDYPVTRIPGLLVFAVNSEKDLVPFLSHIFVPSTILEGPDATAGVLEHFNRCALSLLNNFGQPAKGQTRSSTKTALEALKEEIFATRVREKIADLKYTDHLSVEDWQVLHAFVTIMYRNDAAARQWLSMLMNELDAIMTQLATHKVSAQPALGTSHPDC
jgi:hydroxymethylpyrimidine pyrophosphatase-like HAD family hydrolase